MARVKRPKDLDEVAELGKMLGDPMRVKVLAIVAFDGPICVGDVCKKLNVPQPCASHHLGLLRMARLVVPKRVGKNVVYSLARGLARRQAIEDMQAILAKLIR